MSFLQAMIYAHVLAGALWTLLSLAVAVTRRAPRALLGSLLVAALVALLTGITVWHALHAGPFGPVEHLLVVGTLCAFLALGLQLGIAVPALLGATEARLAGGSLMLYRASAVLLVLAAAAMAGSHYS